MIDMMHVIVYGSGYPWSISTKNLHQPSLSSQPQPKKNLIVGRRPLDIEASF